MLHNSNLLVRIIRAAHDLTRDHVSLELSWEICSLNVAEIERQRARENWDFVEETSVRENRFLAVGLLPFHLSLWLSLSSWQFDPWTFV